MNIKIYTTKPKDFASSIEAAGCYINVDDQCLLLRLPPSKPKAGKWSIPGGKLEPSETPTQAILREVFEETGIQLHQVEYVKTIYIQKPSASFTFHLFRTRLPSFPTLQLSSEHDQYAWVKDITTIPLMEGALEILQYYK